MNKDDSIFLKRKNWGMTSDSQLIVISKSSEKYDTTNDEEEYIYEGLSKFYYKQLEDTLFIYTNNIPSDTPPKFTSKIKIVQIEIKYWEAIDLYRDNEYLNQSLKMLGD